MQELAGSSARRIRIGLTGLAIAFLFILLGSVVSRSSRDEAGNEVEEPLASEPSEPLAELGVAPGAKDEVETNNSASQ